MSIENAGEQTPSEDLSMDDTLAAAFDDATSDDIPDTPLEAGGDESPPDDTQIDKGRPRDERGRFASAAENEADEELEAQPETEASEETVEVEAEAEAETADEAEAQAPAAWSKEDKELFYSLPKEAQQVLALREQQRDTALNHKFQEIAETRKQAEAFAQVTAPFQQIMASEGVDALTATHELMSAYATLRMGSPEQKRSILTNLAQANGVDLSALTGGYEEGQSYQDPAVNQLTQRLGSVEQMLSQANAQRQQQTAAEAASELQQFASDPKYQHIEELRQDMADFVRRGDSLDVAYNKALKLNDELQAKIAQEQQEQLTAKAAAEAKRKAAEAKKAAGRQVRSSGVRAGGSGSLSMEDTLADAYDRATS